MLEMIKTVQVELEFRKILSFELLVFDIFLCFWFMVDVALLKRS